MVSSLHALKASLNQLGLPFRTGPFESVSLMMNMSGRITAFRCFPFPAFPILSTIRAWTAWRGSTGNALNEAVDALFGAVERLEASHIFFKKFEGNICLSNPQSTIFTSTMARSRWEKPHPTAAKDAVLDGLYSCAGSSDHCQGNRGPRWLAGERSTGVPEESGRMQD